MFGIDRFKEGSALADEMEEPVGSGAACTLAYKKDMAVLSLPSGPQLP
jgi:hypothetical protein